MKFNTRTKKIELSDSEKQALQEVARPTAFSTELIINEVVKGYSKHFQLDLTVAVERLTEQFSDGH